MSAEIETLRQSMNTEHLQLGANSRNRTDHERDGPSLHEYGAAGVAFSDAAVETRSDA